MATNLLDVNAFAVERSQINEKIKIFEQGTKLASANVTVRQTASSAVEVKTTADIVLNEDIEIEVSENADFEAQGFIIRDELEEHYKTFNVNVKLDGFNINVEVERKDGSGFYDSGWNIFHDFDPNYECESEDDECKFEDHVEVTVRTKEFSFEKDGKTYVIESFEYKRDVSLIAQGGTNQPDGGDIQPPNGGVTTPPSVEVKPPNGGGTVIKPSVAKLLSVKIKGTNVVGNTLSAEVKDINGNNVNTGLSYRWYRMNSANSAYETLVSTNPRYKLQKDDVNKYIRVMVSNGENSVEDISGKISKKPSSGGGGSSSGGSSSGGSSGSLSSSSSSDSSNSSTIDNSNDTSSNVTVSQSSTATLQAKEDGSIKLVNAEGAPATGWQRVGGKWYFMKNDGSMTTGWLKDTNEKWYYLNSDGSMAANTYVDGYYIGSKGAWVK